MHTYKFEGASNDDTFEGMISFFIIILTSEISLKNLDVDHQALEQN